MGLRVLWWLVCASAADPWAYVFCGGWCARRRLTHGPTGSVVAMAVVPLASVLCVMCVRGLGWTCLDLPGLT